VHFCGKQNCNKNQTTTVSTITSNYLSLMSSANIFHVQLTSKRLSVFNIDYSSSAFVDNQNRAFYTVGSEESCSSDGLYLCTCKRSTGQLTGRLFVENLEDMEQTAQLMLLLAKKTDDEFMCVISKGKWFSNHHIRLYHVLVEKMEQMFHYRMEKWCEEPEQPLMAIYDFESKLVVHSADSVQNDVEFLFVESYGEEDKRKMAHPLHKQVCELQDVASKLEKQIEEMEPIGTIKLFAGSHIPDRWLACNGQELDRSGHERLYEAIASSFHTSETSFRLPSFSPTIANEDSDGLCYIIRAE